MELFKAAEYRESHEEQQTPKKAPDTAELRLFFSINHYLLYLRIICKKYPWNKKHQEVDPPEDLRFL